MQSRRQHLSRLGPAFLCRSASSSKSFKCPATLLPILGFNIRRYAHDRQPTLHNDETAKERQIGENTSSKGSISKMSKTRTFRPVAVVEDFRHLKKPSNNSRTTSPIRRVGSLHIRSMGPVDKEREKVQLAHKAAVLEALREAMLRESNVRRTFVGFWNLRKLPSEVLKLRARKREAHMKRKTAAVWRLLDVAENQLASTGWQLDLIRRRLEIWTHFATAEKQVEDIDMRLDDIARRVPIKSWKELEVVEAQLDLFGKKLETVEELLVMKRQQMKLSTKRRNPVSTPSGLLSHWLSTKDISEREQYWLKNKVHHRISSLPMLLVVYLRRSTNPDLTLDEFDQWLVEASMPILHRRGLTVKDVAEWAWILSADKSKEMVERFMSSPSKKPTFLLLQILKRNIEDVRSLKLLLIHSWDQVQSNPGPITGTEGDIAAIVHQLRTSSSDTNVNIPSLRPLTMELNSFLSMFRGLLYQARRIWPPAVVSIAHMFAPFLDIQLGSGPRETRELDFSTHLRVCKVFNQMLRILALPASINPYKSMLHNWQAQKIILEITTHFRPPLLIDRNSYRAVAQVLAASKKSERESRVASLRTRSWPPWRVEQDGMDAQRSPEDDLSRVVEIASQAKESGYSEDPLDQAIRVLGGQEPDGTPTIPSRKLVLRRVRRRESLPGPPQADLDARIWTARIESTRDVQEAWSAFNGYQEKGQKPTMAMYFAMIEKLEFEGARTGRLIQHRAAPGAGKEVLEPSNDNFSKFYRSRLQPPDADELYRQMLHAEIRPHGRFLTFLIQHAKTPDQAFGFISDAKIHNDAFPILKGTKPMPTNFLEKFPQQVFTAYITMLCRFAPRAIRVTEESVAESGDNPPKSEWQMYELAVSRKHRRQPGRGLDIFLRTAELLKQSQTQSRPAWYAFFSALARRDVVVERSLAGHPKNDILSWKVLLAALHDFHKCGLELDPRGFLILCNGLEKAILAAFKLSEEERVALFDGSQLSIVVDQFMKLSEADEQSELTLPTLPTLLHRIEGVHLHAYVRVLGLKENYDGLMYVVQWMVKHHGILDDIATQSENGWRLIKRTLVAMKVFLGRTEHEAEAERLMNNMEHWGGWPLDSEAQEYINRGSGWVEDDDDEP